MGTTALTVQAAQLAELSTNLTRARNGDGGWGYYPGKASRLEATSWAVLALNHGKSVDLAASALRSWPTRDGLLLERRGGDPNYGFHGIALLTLLACGVEHELGNAALAAGLLRVQGLTAKNYEILRQDNTLIAWSWVPNTMSWIEPTAWCLLSLKKWARTRVGQVDAGRLDQAERFILDRVCSVGGWNHGNPNVLATDLRPYVPTTAIALLAMQDKRTDPQVQRSLAYLEGHALAERTAGALALTACACSTYDRPTEPIRGALVDQLPVSLTFGNHAALASALYALRTDHEYGAFKL